MVIGDDDFHAELIRTFDRHDVGYAAIDGDEQVGFLASQLLDCFDIQAEALVMAVRDIDREVREADPAEEVVHHDRAGYAVGVIVGVYGDALAFFDGLNDPVGGFFRVFEQEWVVHVAFIVRCHESLSSLDVGEAAMEEEMREKRRKYAELVLLGHRKRPLDRIIHKWDCTM